MSRPILDPDAVTVDGDPGDDVARRFRYQFAYAAFHCCALLDDTLDVVEVFCEHHEDVLLKHRDGLFTGCQVKTRAQGDPWKATEEAIIGACVRFMQLESLFPGKFRRFVIYTNHVFHVADSGTSLPHLLQLRSACVTWEEADPKLKKYIERVSCAAKCAFEVGFAAFSKVRCDDRGPKLQDIQTRLIDALATGWARAKDCTLDAVGRSAYALIGECFRASSLEHLELLPIYLSAASDPSAMEKHARIEGKRFNAERLTRILEGSLSGTELLAGPIESVPGPDASNPSLLKKKLNAGGFSATSIHSALDLRDKAEYQALAWTKRFGREEGLRRYDHVRTIVLRDCADSYEEAKTPENGFGREMLAKLRQAFFTRKSSGEDLFGCREEHFEGFAYVLTGECKVRWSNGTPWEEP
jgi:hypothetical protein